MKKKKRSWSLSFLPYTFRGLPGSQRENIYLKIALKYVQTIQDAPTRQLLKADFKNFSMDTYGCEPVYMLCFKLACSFGLGCHNISS